MRKDQPGIYSITSPSGGVYIGSASSFKDRWSLHRRDLRAGKHHSKPLQRAWDKYGEASMVFEIMILCEKRNLLVYEQILIDGMKPRYNVRKIAGSNAGLKASPETIERMRIAQTGRKHSPEARARMSESGKNRPAIGEDTRSKMRSAKLGRKLSAETRARCSVARTGVPQTPLQLARNSESHKGKKQSAELVEKRIAPLRGIPRPTHVKIAMQSPEAKAKRAESMRLYYASPEARQKMADAVRAGKAAKKASV